MHKNIKRRQCILCLKPLYLESSLYHLLCEPKLCMTCIQQLEVLDRRKKQQGYEMHILYVYNEFFRQLLYQYKALYDIALKDTFLDIFHSQLKRKYRKHLVIIAPSSQRDNEIRGFVPNEEIVKTITSHIFTGIYKTKEYKQTSQVNRTNVKNILAITGGEQICRRKIVIFDDVITSGNTIDGCINLVKQYQPKSIEVIVLATNQVSTLFTK